MNTSPMHTEALSYLLKKESLVLIFSENMKKCMGHLSSLFPKVKHISGDLPANGQMESILETWEADMVAVLELGETEASSIVKNFLSNMLMHGKATPFPFGKEYLLAEHKLIIVAHHGTNDLLRSFVQAVHE